MSDFHISAGIPPSDNSMYATARSIYIAAGLVPDDIAATYAVSGVIKSFPPFWQKPIRGTQINKAHPLAKGLVAAWIMNERTGGIIFDSSGNSNEGIITEADWASDGLDFGSATSNSEYVYTNDSRIIDLPATKNFSFVVSATPNYSGSASRAMIAWGGTDDLLFYPNDPSAGSGSLRLFWRDCGASNINYAGADLIGIKTSFALTACEGEQKVYQDGVEVDSDTNDLSGSGPFNNFRIGNWADSADQPFGGIVQYVYLYDHVLTQGEIIQLHHDPYSFMRPSLHPAIIEYITEAPASTILPLLIHLYNQMRS